MKRLVPTLSLLLAFLKISVIQAFQPEVLPFAWNKEPSEYLVRNFTVDDGLPVNTTGAILHHSSGYIFVLTLDGLARFDGATFKVFDSSNTPGFISNRLLGMLEGKSGELWITDSIQNLYLFRNNKAKRLQDNKSFENLKVFDMKKTWDGTLWIGTNAGLWYQDEGMNFVQVQGEQLNKSVGRLHVSTDDRIYFMTAEGLYEATKETTKKLVANQDLLIPYSEVARINTTSDTTIWLITTGEFQEIDKDLVQHKYLLENYRNQEVFYVQEMGANDLLIDTDVGYFALDRKSRKLRVTEVFGQPKDFTNNKVLISSDGKQIQNNRAYLFVDQQPIFRFPFPVREILEDREGSIWVTTGGGGVFQFIKKKFYTIGSPEYLGLANVYGIFEAEQGEIWVPSFNGKIFKLEEGKVSVYRAFIESEEQNLFTTVYQTSSGDFFMGSMDIWEFSDNEWEYIKNPDVGLITAFFEDSEGQLWMGAEKGLYQFTNREQIEFEDRSGKKLTQVRGIYEQPNGDLLFATTRDGIAILDGSDEFRFLNTETGLSSNLVRDLFIESPDTLWAVTENMGLNRLILTQEYRVLQAGHLTTEDGLIDNSLHRLLLDEFGFFWINSNNGIMRIRKSEVNAYLDGKINGLFVESFGVADGLKNKEGNGGMQNSGMIASDGKLLFPNQAGLIYSRPEWHLPQAKHQAENPIAESIIFQDSVVSLLGKRSFSLPESVREVQIKFTLPTFESPDKLILEYKLEGINTNWQRAGSERLAVFTNLPKGEHHFLMKGKLRGKDGYSEAAVVLIVPALFYETVWFILLVVLSLGMIVFLSLRIQLSRSRQREQKLNALVGERTHRLEEALQEVKNLEEAKTRFFTNFTHELRTPLSLILAPIEDMLEQKEGADTGRDKRNLSLMKQSATRLKEQVNRLLDVSRLNADEFTIRVEAVPLAALTTRIASQFENVFEQKNISFSIRDRTKNGIVYVDVTAWEDICINLLDNALKHIPEQGSISVILQEKDDGCLVEVSDTGNGISEKDLPFIFDTYYQADSSVNRAGGTGIGLALVRGLVERMHGSIRAKSKLGEGTTISILLKNGSEHFTPEEIQSHKPVTISKYEQTVEVPATDLEGNYEAADTGENKQRILLVEDNEDFRSYFAGIIGQHYQIETAANGKLGLEKLETYQPDLIVSDIMMPEMDGYEMMRLIREKPEFRTTPFIFLSAKDSSEDFEKGLNSGADIYLTKPLKNRELLLQIKVLLRREQLLRAPEEVGQNMTLFTQKVTELLRRHLGNPELGVDMIAERLAMSRSTLFRKWRKENDLPMVQIITKMRLEEAVRLIKTDDLTISEAAFAVGYKHLSHFSRAFKRVYSQAPQDYLKQHT